MSHEDKKLLQMDCATCLSVQILQLQNILGLFENDCNRQILPSSDVPKFDNQKNQLFQSWKNRIFSVGTSLKSKTADPRWRHTSTSGPGPVLFIYYRRPFVMLAFENQLEYWNSDFIGFIGHQFCTLCEILVRFGSVTPEFKTWEVVWPASKNLPHLI